MVRIGTGWPVWAVGLMSGTSMDGMDIAAIETDGHMISSFGPTAFEAFSDAERLALRAAIERGARSLRVPDGLYATMQQSVRGDVHHDEFAEVYRALDRAAIAAYSKLGVGGPVVMGLHGQTVAHAPDDGVTFQVCDPSALTAAACTPVVWEFRKADVQAGGQGAPLAPFFHFALAKYLDAAAPVAFLNIGGVANVTWVDPVFEVPSDPGALVAFDTGPGNALINDWMTERAGAPYDVDGRAAATGTIHAGSQITNSGQAYLDRSPPKSLDRNDFHGVLGAMDGLSVNDGAATLAAFTADCVAASLLHMPSPPTRWLVCGGGRHNKTMMRMLAERLDAPVEPVEAVGLDGDMLEAQAFAYLAVRVLRGLPTSAPSTTGCREPVCGGRISYP